MDRNPRCHQNWTQLSCLIHTAATEGHWSKSMSPQTPSPGSAAWRLEPVGVYSLCSPTSTDMASHVINPIHWHTAVCGFRLCYYCTMDQPWTIATGWHHTPNAHFLLTYLLTYILTTPRPYPLTPTLKPYLHTNLQPTSTPYLRTTLLPYLHPTAKPYLFTYLCTPYT